MKKTSRRSVSAKSTADTMKLAEKLQVTEQALKAAQKTIAEQERREQESKQLLATRALSEETTNADPIVQAKINALTNIHNQKVKSLMRSIDQLKQQIGTMKAGDKEHRRSSLIQNLRNKQREQELITDVLKETLKEKCTEFNQSRDLVNEFIIKKTTGGPKRFRPKTREEMEIELNSLDKKLKRTLVKLKQANSSNNATAAATLRAPEAPVKTDYPVEDPDEPAHENVGELLSELDEVKVLLESREVQIKNQEEELAALSSQIREYKEIEGKLSRVQEKYKAGKDTIRCLEEENLQLIQEKEREIEQKAQALAEVKFLRESSQIEAKASSGDQIQQLKRLQELQQKEMQLQLEFEEYQKRACNDRNQFLDKIRTYESKEKELLETIEKLKTEQSHREEKCDTADAKQSEIKSQPEDIKAHTDGPDKESIDLEELRNELQEKSQEIASLQKQLTAAKMLDRRNKKEIEKITNQLTVNSKPTETTAKDVSVTAYSEEVSLRKSLERKLQDTAQQIENLQKEKDFLTEKMPLLQQEFHNELIELQKAEGTIPQEQIELAIEKSTQSVDNTMKFSKAIQQMESEIEKYKIAVEKYQAKYDKIFVHATHLQTQLSKLGKTTEPLPCSGEATESSDDDETESEEEAN